VVAILPTLSPVVIAWYMAERYLYLGAAFFCIILAFALNQLESYFKVKRLSLYIIILISLLYSVRTFIRTLDFINTKHLAFATVKTLPNSIHAQTDLAYVYMDERIIKNNAIYISVLINLNSATTTHNLGFIYIMGFPDNYKPLSLKSSNNLF
jgi:hypothetical protein